MHLRQESPRIGDVLDQVGEVDDGEAGIRKTGLRERPGEYVHAAVTSAVLRGLSADIDPLHDPPLLPHGFQEHTGCAADVEKRPGPLEPRRPLLEAHVAHPQLHEMEEVALVLVLVFEIALPVSSTQVFKHGGRVLVDRVARGAAHEGEAVAREKGGALGSSAERTGNRKESFGAGRRGICLGHHINYSRTVKEISFVVSFPTKSRTERMRWLVPACRSTEPHFRRASPV